MDVLKVYNAYRPHWTPLEFLAFLSCPNTVSVLGAPELIVMERMVVAVFLAPPRLGNRLPRSIAGAGVASGKVTGCLRAHLLPLAGFADTHH